MISPFRELEVSFCDEVVSQSAKTQKSALIVVTPLTLLMVKSILVGESHSGSEQAGRQRKRKSDFCLAAIAFGLAGVIISWNEGDDGAKGADDANQDLWRDRFAQEKECPDDDQDHVEPEDRRTDSRTLVFHRFNQQNVGRRENGLKSRPQGVSMKKWKSGIRKPTMKANQTIPTIDTNDHIDSPLECYWQKQRQSR